MADYFKPAINCSEVPAYRHLDLFNPEPVRIIGGSRRGACSGSGQLPVRPTTDYAKTGLFSILSNRIDFESVSVTGPVFAEQGYQFNSLPVVHFPLRLWTSMQVCALRSGNGATAGLPASGPIKRMCFVTPQTAAIPYDIVFADPPFELEGIRPSAGTGFEQRLAGT